ncbi:MAG: 1-deoxy-D-xylulose-5-phosphate reductoisomerase [Planctomycetota bacterium]
MSLRPRNLVILGSTGSIGRSTLDVVAAAPERFQVVGLSANSQIELLTEQIRRFQPRWVTVTDPAAAARLDLSQLPPGTLVRTGSDAVASMVSEKDVDVVVSAIVGSAGLLGTWAALDAGKPVALANKETLVMAGPQVMQLAAARQVSVVPVDSEHSAVFQLLAAGRRADVAKVILTASGGPFRRHTREQLERVTVADALAHPTWNMGRKITVDSATMMNKSLEIIEARWLFGFPAEQIDVMIHPQSIVHSLVEFRDGSVVAQLSPPDMKLPIQYALTYPERFPCPAPKMPWQTSFHLDFEPPDLERFPALKLGFQVAREGGTTGAVLNAANEAAVAAFLDERLAYNRIVPVCEAVLANHDYDSNPSLDVLLQLDRWARQEVAKWIGC